MPFGTFGITEDQHSVLQHALLPDREQGPEVCDATRLYSSNTAGHKNIQLLVNLCIEPGILLNIVTGLWIFI